MNQPLPDDAVAGAAADKYLLSISEGDRKIICVTLLKFLALYRRDNLTNAPALMASASLEDRIAVILDPPTGTGVKKQVWVNPQTQP